ncbi:hypothetical protein TWF694_004540 [Orbilia ellipsospora]|uniref:Uncharacterized protein n=1 Tax=Orbilia ellipsospora TaxID=2528407 RepID=A0AAV9WWW2_9PEZI
MRRESYILALYSIWGGVAFASPLVRAGGSGLFDLARADRSEARIAAFCEASLRRHARAVKVPQPRKRQQQPQGQRPQQQPRPQQRQQRPADKAQPQLQTSTPENQRMSLWDRIKKVPGDLVNGFKQAPKVVSKENVKAFQKSAGDLNKGASEVPGAVVKGGKAVASVENGKALKKSAGDFKKGVIAAPAAVVQSAKKVGSKENGDAIERSWEDLKKGVKEIPPAMAKGGKNLKQGLEDAGVAISKAPGQLSKTLSEGYDRSLPPGSNARKVADSVAANVPPLGMARKAKQVVAAVSGAQKAKSAVNTADKAGDAAKSAAKAAKDEKEVKEGWKHYKKVTTGMYDVNRKAGQYGRDHTPPSQKATGSTPPRKGAPSGRQ